MQKRDKKIGNEDDEREYDKKSDKVENNSKNIKL